MLAGKFLHDVYAHYILACCICASGHLSVFLVSELPQSVKKKCTIPAAPECAGHMSIRGSLVHWWSSCCISTGLGITVWGQVDRSDKPHPGQSP